MPLKPLTLEEKQWVDQTLARMSIEERIAQTLIPTVHGRYEGLDDVLRTMKDIPLGGVFTGGAKADMHSENLAKLQAASKVPLIIAADLECGAGHIVEGAVPFPDPLATAAADDEELAYTMGKASALQGRSVGFHWTYAPVVDVNVNADNPIANTRSLGDDPDRISRLACSVLRGMQDHGLAACAKHFPGDGVDDMDQHTVTSVNSLTLDQWKQISGRTFFAAIDAGVWSIMIGHIALPSWDPEVDHRGCYRPASVNYRIVTELLRKEMGFDGLIVTDDMNMGGVAGYMPRRQRVVGCIKAGCDMLLFPWLPGDFETLKKAVSEGELSEERVTDAARRVLEAKARLGLHKSQPAAAPLKKEEVVTFVTAARTMSEKAICKVRDLNALLPLRDLKPGAKVLTMTMSMEDIDLPVVDDELKSRGFNVDHFLNAHDFRLFEKLPAYDAIFVNLVFRANWAYQSVRSVGIHNRIFIGGFYADHACVVFTSFGSPYHLRMYNTFPNLVNVHSAVAESQRAAVKAWLGEIPMSGRSPVGNLTRPPVIW